MIERENSKVSKCFFLSKGFTGIIYFIVNLGLFLRTVKMMHELVAKLFILIGG